MGNKNEDKSLFWLNEQCVCVNIRIALMKVLCMQGTSRACIFWKSHDIWEEANVSILVGVLNDKTDLIRIGDYLN